MEIAVGAGGTVGKPSVFFARLFQAVVEIIKKKSPKASLFDFHSCGSYAELGITAAELNRLLAVESSNFRTIE